MPKVSVVMAVYNHEKFVAESIESVINQTYNDWELIITNDGSTDQSLNIIKQYNNPRIKLFSFDKNTGARVARNNSIKYAQGEYIAVINSDDVWLSDKLKKQTNFLNANPDIGAVFSYASFINDESEDIGYNHYYGRIFIQPNKNRFDWLKHFFLSGNCLCHPSVVIRKLCHENLGLYNERFGQLSDFDMWVRLVTRYPIHILPENLVKFRLLKNMQNISAQTPEKMSRYTLEQYRVLKNYLNPEIYNNFTKIFDCETDLQQIGITKINHIDAETAPFLLAMIARKKGHPSWDLFSFDILYDLCRDKNTVEKLKDQYGFNYSTLISLALKQDIFSIVSLNNTSNLLTETQQKLSSCSNKLEEKESLIKQISHQLEQKTKELEAHRSLEKSITKYHRQIETAPNSFLLHQKLGETLTNEKDLLDQAITEFKKAIELKPDSALSYGYLGETLVKQGLLEEAINYLKKAIKIQPKFYRFYNSLGVAFLKQENWDEAISNFEKAIELKPNLAWGYYNLGLIFSCQEKLETASNYFATAAKLNPSLLNTNLLDKYDNYLSKIGVAQWDIIQPIKCLITTELISIPENSKEEILTFHIDKLELTDGEETVQILLSGWIFGRQSKVIYVQILRSNLLIQTVSMNVPRPDVLQNYSYCNLELEENTGFNTSWNVLKSFISDKDELTLKAVFANNTSLPFKVILLNKKFAVSDRSGKKRIDTIP